VHYLKFILGILVFLHLSGCSDGGFDAVYTGAGGTQEFQFSSDGTLTQSLQGNEVAKYEYKKDGNKIKVYLNEKTTQVWTQHKNGDISVPPGLTLTIKK